MDRFVILRRHSRPRRLGGRHALWLSTVLLCCSLTAPAQKQLNQGHERTIQHSSDSSAGIRKR
jgi:hypothetical protein